MCLVVGNGDFHFNNAGRTYIIRSTKDHVVSVTMLMFYMRPMLVIITLLRMSFLFI